MQRLHQIESVKALTRNPAEHQEKKKTLLSTFG
jgi:hypothetical protein